MKLVEDGSWFDELLNGNQEHHRQRIEEKMQQIKELMLTSAESEKILANFETRKKLEAPTHGSFFLFKILLLVTFLALACYYPYAKDADKTNTMIAFSIFGLRI